MYMADSADNTQRIQEDLNWAQAININKKYSVHDYSIYLNIQLTMFWFDNSSIFVPQILLSTRPRDVSRSDYCNYLSL